METKKTRKTYTNEFKAQAVQLCEYLGVTQVCEELGISRASMLRWKKEFGSEKQTSGQPS